MYLWKNYYYCGNNICNCGKYRFANWQNPPWQALLPADGKTKAKNSFAHNTSGPYITRRKEKGLTLLALRLWLAIDSRGRGANRIQPSCCAIQTAKTHPGWSGRIGGDSEAGGPARRAIRAWTVLSYLIISASLGANKIWRTLRMKRTVSKVNWALLSNVLFVF